MLARKTGSNDIYGLIVVFHTLRNPFPGKTARINKLYYRQESVGNSFLANKTGADNILGFTLVFRILRNPLPVKMAQMNRLQAGKLLVERAKQEVSCTVSKMKNSLVFQSILFYFFTSFFYFITAYILRSTAYILHFTAHKFLSKRTFFFYRIHF